MNKTIVQSFDNLFGGGLACGTTLAELPFFFFKANSMDDYTKFNSWLSEIAHCRDLLDQAGQEFSNGHGPEADILLDDTVETINQLRLSLGTSWGLQQSEVVN